MFLIFVLNVVFVVVLFLLLDNPGPESFTLTAQHKFLYRTATGSTFSTFYTFSGQILAPDAYQIIRVSGSFSSGFPPQSSGSNSYSL